MIHIWLTKVSSGASYTATGFDWKGTQPSPSNPLGNPSTYQGHTACNGPNFIQYLTRKYNDSRVQTYDFAWAGAPTTGVRQQVYNDFLPNYIPGKKLCPGWDASTTVFPMFVGINDLDHWNTAANVTVYRNGVFGNYSDAVKAVSLSPSAPILESQTDETKQLYNAGARNFILYNVPPLNRGPEFLSTAASKKTAVDDYNARLRTMTVSLSKAHGDANFWLVDMNQLFNDVLDKKDRFSQTKGYQVLDANCKYYADNWMQLPSMTYKNADCPYRVDEYFWLNGRHVTFPLHDLLAMETRDGVGG